MSGRPLVIVTLVAMTAVVVPAARGQEGLDDPEPPPGTVTVLGEFTSGKFLDPGTMATSADQTLVYWDYQLVDHDLVFRVFPSVGGEPTPVIGYGEVAQRHEWELDHFLNGEPVTTRRAFTKITEMDFDGTWDGNDPGRIEGTVTWAVPEDRVDVEWNEHSWGPVPSPTNGIFTGPGPDGVFTATWSPSSGVMRGELDTGPWDGGFEAFAVTTESPSSVSPGRPGASLPCFFDGAPGSTSCDEGEDPAHSFGLGILGALASLGRGADDLPSDDQKQRTAVGWWMGGVGWSRITGNTFTNVPAAAAETNAWAGLYLGSMRRAEGGDAPLPVFSAAAPLFVGLAKAETKAEKNIADKKMSGTEPTAEDIAALTRARQTSLRLIRMLVIWEAEGFMPSPIHGRT
ncbi:MAG: hypothetical protein HKO63_07645 [Acidimicrobiia bacterium]|nr:hypothetical protein [Acidimicrobiia bacterium]NNF87868.1 hypothetical protein [Acidimicrobiia bacterium]NNL98062.1 hypothetical protein [Acidimicrobiia bacterium]